jgi:membrane protease YdiL (CAAX protease family)
MNTLKPKFPWLYLLLAYGLAWIFWIPVALTGQDYQTSPILLAVMFLGTFGPGIAGIIMTYREQGKEGGRDFWRRVFDFRRISLKWYALIFLLYPILQLLAVVVTQWLGGNPPDFAFVRENLTVPAGVLAVVVLYLLQAGLEELGWRGYMLDRLQQSWEPLPASLILGLVHTFWHLPTFWIIGTNQSDWTSGIEPLAFIGFVVAGSIYSTWCYNANQRSTLATILLHAVGNFSAAIFAMSGPGKHVFTILLSISAVIIAITWLIPSKNPKRVAMF